MKSCWVMQDHMCRVYLLFCCSMHVDFTLESHVNLCTAAPAVVKTLLSLLLVGKCIAQS